MSLITNQNVTMLLPEPLAVWVGTLEQGVGRDVCIVLVVVVVVRDNCYPEGGNKVGCFLQPIRLQALVESAQGQRS